MKKAAIFSLFAAILLSGTVVSHAGSVTGASAYGDTNIVCYLYQFSPTDQSLLMGTGAIPMDQYASGTLNGYITTDGDPTLMLGNTINNAL